MSKKIKYEWTVAVGDGGGYTISVPNRASARAEKRYWKENDVNAKILQKKYVLESQKEVR